MADQIRKIEIKVDTGQSKEQLKSISKELGAISKNTGTLADGFDFAKNAMVAFASSMAVRTFTGMADSMQLLNDRIKALLGSQEKATTAFKYIADIAKTTNAPIDEVANTFARITVATQRMNLGVRATAELTQILGNSFRLSGATTEEATASTIQFSQALSFGQLRGQELRSVLSQNATLATIFGKAIEGSGKDIYKFAEAGGFTTKFILTALAKEMGNINEQAAKLGTTFSQSLTKALNELKIRVGDINKEFDLNGKFATFINFLIDNSSATIAALSGIAAALTAVAISGISVSSAFAFLSAPLTAVVAGIGLVTAGLVYFGTGTETLTQKIDNLKNSMDNLGLYATGTAASIVKALGGPQKELQVLIDLVEKAKRKQQASKDIKEGNDPTSDEYYNKMKRMAKDTTDFGTSLEAQANAMANARKSTAEQIKELNEQFNAGKVSVTSYNEKILSLTETLLKSQGPTKFANEIAKIKMESLTREVDSGIISFEEFNDSMVVVNLENLDRKLKSGAVTLSSFREQTEKINLGVLSDNFERGYITAEQFRKGLDDSKLKELNNSLAAGKIRVSEFVSERNKLAEFSIPYTVYQGIDDYVNRIGNLSRNISGVITGAFDKMENAMVDFTKTGRFIFKDFFQAILDDVNRLIIRMAIIQPIAKGMLNFSGMDAGGGLEMGSIAAKGFAPEGTGVNMFALGGIVNSPTAFKYGGSKTGIMGEAGPEAILPLTRDTSGKLGVSAKGGGSNVVVNIINQTGNSEVTQTESTGSDGTRVLDILIKSKMQENFGNGSMDKTMGQNYGIRRKGN